MKHVNWIVAGVFALAFLWVAWIVQPAPQTQIIDETRYIPSEAISKDAFEQQRYRADIAEIRADLLDSQTSWFEILTSSMIGLFGILITVVLIFFAFRFGKQAVDEAKFEARNMFSEFSEGIESTQASSMQALEQAEKLVEEIRGHHKTAKDMMADFDPKNPTQDQDVRRSVRDVAKAALEKSRKERSADDYRALIITASLDEDWPKVEQRAAAMVYLFHDECSDEDIVFALYLRGYALGEMSRTDEEIEVYDLIIKDYGESDNASLQERVANTLVNKGIALVNKSPPDLDGAIASCDDVVSRYGKSDNVALQKPIAKALVNKGVALGSKSPPDLDGAIASYDDVVARYGKSDNVALQEPVARALVFKGVALGSKSPPDLDGVIASYDDVVARYGKSNNFALQQQVANALFNKGLALNSKSPSDLDGAIVSYDDVVSRYGKSDNAALQELAAKALVNKGRALGRKSPLDLDGAIARYDDVVLRYGESDNVALQEPVARALVFKGIALGSKCPPDLDGAIASYDDVVSRYGKSDNVALQEAVANALVNKVIALRHKSPPDLDGAIASCDKVIKRRAGSSKGLMREIIVGAFFNKACLLALKDKVKLTIQALSAWADYVGHMDCNKIAENSDFDKVRDRASFQKFLREHDCQTASQSPNDET